MASGFCVSPILCIVGSIFWLRNIDTEAGGHQKVRHIRYSLSYAPKRDLIANFAFNTHTAIGGLVWPIYLALALSTINAIGIVTTLGALLAAVALLFIGSRNDRIGTHNVLAEGSRLTFFSHMLRLVPATIATVTFINVVWSLALRYQLNPWTSTYYSHTREKGMNYILSMEIACDIAYVVTFVATFALIYLLGQQVGFMLLFVSAAFMSLLCNLITPAKN